MASRKVILTCAITGSGHTPSMSPHLPYTIDDVVNQSIEAAEAGASIIHLHARDPRDGRPTPSRQPPSPPRGGRRGVGRARPEARDPMPAPGWSQPAPR